jgi:hypothetical protein
MSRPTAEELQAFYLQLDQIDELSGAGVAYVGDGQCSLLRIPRHSSGLKTFVILKEEDLDDGEDLPGANDVSAPNLAVELVGLGLNCGGAVLSWAALGGEVAAAPVSGGGSLTLTVITWAAAVATTAQCANSLIRSVDVAVYHGQWTRWLDSQDYYIWAGDVLDGVSIVGATAAGAATVRTVLALRRATGRELTSILKGLNRAERKRLTQELIRMQIPNISNSAMKDLIRAGQFPARFAASQITDALFAQLRDAIAATMAFGSSAVSGDVKLLYVDIFQE